MPRERKIGYERRETTATISKYSCIGMWPLFESDSNEDLHFSPTKDTALLDDATPRYNDTLSQSAKNEEDAIQIEDANPLEDATPLKLLPITGQSQENHERERSYLTHFVSPGEFYVQDEQEQMMHKSVLFKLTHLYNSKDTEIKSIENVEYGQLYACKQEGRQLWERCKILKPGSDSQNQFAVQLIDVGAVLTLSKEELCYIDTDLLEIPPLAKHCQLWGLRPAGHISQWSKSSIDHASEMFKSAKAYIKVYHTETSQDYESTIHYVRLFFEKVQLGGALECDQYITTCLNDDLFEKGLALRHSMTVSTHPSNRWPCKREIPGEFAAVPISFEDDGFVYLHASGAHNQREAIAELLEWHYAKMNSEEEESNLWKKNAPCIIK